MIELVAMAPGGEYFVSRDDRGVLRRHDLYLPGDPLEMGEKTLERLLADGAVDAVGERVDDWQELQARADALVPRVPFDAGAPLSPELVAAAPRVLARWLDDPRRRALLRRVVPRMLTRPEVSASPETVQHLARILEELDSERPQTVVRMRRKQQVDEYFGKAAA